jgi:hypothetical protein
MQASDFPNCEFADCDSCRTPYAGHTTVVVVEVRRSPARR